MPPLPPLDLASHPISPELALVDRDLAELSRVAHRDEPEATEPPVGFLESDMREAVLRICELSDVNPPRPRRRLLLAVAAPAALWAEALMLVASFVPLGAL